ncbi:MAG TPA: hypothetical protein VGO93_17355 [Candidatus Xenobia bacterium]
MGFQEDFARAVRETEVRRQRTSRLLTVGTTELPYVLLSTSVVNLGDTVVRQGMVRVEPPTLLLLNRPHQFEGFEDEESPAEGLLALGRMARFPPGKYSNIDSQLDVFEGTLESAISQVQTRLDNAADRQTGVVIGPADLWNMSLLVYVSKMIVQSAPHDVEQLLARPTFKPRWSSN